jgi:hypothetical protein
MYESSKRRLLMSSVSVIVCPASRGVEAFSGVPILVLVRSDGAGWLETTVSLPEVESFRE